MSHRNPAAGQRPPPWPGAPICVCCTPDPRRRAALARLRAQHDHLAVCRQLQQLGADLPVYYRQPLGGFYCRVVEGRRWAA